MQRSQQEKDDQIRRVRAVQSGHEEAARTALRRLQDVALEGGNVFAEIMRCARLTSLGRITAALYEVGGRYRRAL